MALDRIKAFVKGQSKGISEVFCDIFCDTDWGLRLYFTFVS